MVLRNTLHFEKMKEQQQNQILSILNNAQTGPVNHRRNFLKLQNVYKEMDIHDFTTFILVVIRKTIQNDYHSPYIKNMLDFMGSFVGQIATIENDPDHSFEHPMLRSIIEGLSDEFNSGSENITLNICLFYSYILNNIGNKVVVNNDLGDIIQNVLLKSLKDYRAEVRIQGIIALGRLQNPLYEDCPVIKKFVKCLGDPNYKVRREVILRLAPNQNTLKGTTKAVRDCHPKVRAAAFRHLADIGIKHLRIIQRQHVLQSGFLETHEKTKRVFLDYLLPKWLASADDSFLKFLQLIKLDSSEHDIEQTEFLTEKLMREFVNSYPIERLIEELRLNENKLIPENEIRSEQAVYWNSLYNYLQEAKVSDDLLESIVPELKCFSDYIERLIELRYSNTMETWEILDFHHLLYQLFAMTLNMNFAEEVGRRTLDQLVKKLFKNYSLQPRLLTKLFNISLKLNSHRIDGFIDEMCNIITDIWKPLAVVPLTGRQLIDKACKMAALKVKIIELEDEKEQAINQQNFLKAQSVKVAIDQKKLEVQELNEEGQAAQQQERVAKNDPITLCRCLDLLIALIRQLRDNTLPLALINLRDDFLMPLMGNRNTEVCWRAFKATAAFCVSNEEMAREHIHVLTSPVTFYSSTSVNVNMLVDSISVVTDLILLHGTKFFSPEGDGDNPASRTLYVEDLNFVLLNEFSIDKFISLILDLLDVEDAILRETAIQALANLIVNDFPVNYTLITRLVLKWYSKVTRKTSESRKIKNNAGFTEAILQQIIGFLLTGFAKKSVANKQVIAKAVPSILTQLAEAPPTSPLAAVKIEDPIAFLCALTTEEQGVVHTELAKVLLNELAKEEPGAASVYYAKMLMELHLPPSNSLEIQELVTKWESITIMEDSCPRGQQVQNKLKAFVAKLRNKFNVASKNVSSVTEESGTEAISEDNSNISNVAPIQQINRRLSVVIEDDSSTDSDKSFSEPTNSQEGIASKRRKIEPAPLTENDRSETTLNNVTSTTTSKNNLNVISSARSSRRLLKRLNNEKPETNIVNDSIAEERLGIPPCVSDSEIPNSEASPSNNTSTKEKTNATKENASKLPNSQKRVREKNEGKSPLPNEPEQESVLKQNASKLLNSQKSVQKNNEEEKSRSPGEPEEESILNQNATKLPNSQKRVRKKNEEDNTLLPDEPEEESDLNVSSMSEKPLIVRLRQVSVKSLNPSNKSRRRRLLDQEDCDTSMSEKNATKLPISQKRVRKNNEKEKSRSPDEESDLNVSSMSEKPLIVRLRQDAVKSLNPSNKSRRGRLLDQDDCDTSMSDKNASKLPNSQKRVRKNNEEKKSPSPDEPEEESDLNQNASKLPNSQKRVRKNNKEEKSPSPDEPEEESALNVSSMSDKPLIVRLRQVSVKSLNPSNKSRRRKLLDQDDCDTSMSERRNSKRRRIEKEKHNENLVPQSPKPQSNNIIPLKELQIRVIPSPLKFPSDDDRTSKSSNSSTNQRIVHRTLNEKKRKSIRKSLTFSSSDSINSQPDQRTTRKNSKKAMPRSSSSSASSKSFSQTDNRITRRSLQLMDQESMSEKSSGSPQIPSRITRSRVQKTRNKGNITLN